MPVWGPVFPTFLKGRVTASAVRNAVLVNSREGEEMEVRGREDRERSTRRPAVTET